MVSPIELVPLFRAKSNVALVLEAILLFALNPSIIFVVASNQRNARKNSRIGCHNKRSEQTVSTECAGIIYYHNVNAFSVAPVRLRLRFGDSDTHSLTVTATTLTAQ